MEGSVHVPWTPYRVDMGKAYDTFGILGVAYENQPRRKYETYLLHLYLLA